METDRFLTELIRYAKTLYQEWPDSVSIRLRSGKKIMLPVPPGMCKGHRAAEAPKVQGVPEDLLAAIFGYLDDEGERRTREQVAAALADEFSESAVHKALWRMRVAGVLSNPRRGGGYGLAEWVDTPKPQ